MCEEKEKDRDERKKRDKEAIKKVIDKIIYGNRAQDRNNQCKKKEST